MDEAKNDLTTERVIGSGFDGAGLDATALGELLQKVVFSPARRSGAPTRSVSPWPTTALRTTNATGDDALAIDEAQYEGDDGPWLRALRSARQVQLMVGAKGDGLAEFEATATGVGVTAVLSTPLVRGPGDAIGALNIYSQGEGASPSRTCARPTTTCWPRRSTRSSWTEGETIRCRTATT